ncbi:hypothetical protein IJ541_00945 [bacterium]|nr:hypothetical protein [bacterium]
MADYEITKNTTIDFEVGCGSKTITLGEGGFDTVLNFISDTREGYVSDYQIVSQDLETGSVTIQRRTGTVKSVNNSGIKFNSGYTTDRITITDFLTNGEGKVTFKADAATCYINDENTKTYRIDSVNSLIESIVHAMDLNDPTALTINSQNVSGEYTGSWLSEHLALAKGNVNVNAGRGNDRIVATSFNDGDVKLIHAGEGNDYIMLGGAKDKTTSVSAYGDEGADTYEVVGLYGPNANITLKDADSEDTLWHRVQADSEYSYSRDGQDLIITQTVGENVQTTKIEGHFDKLAEGKQLDKFYVVDANHVVQEDLSLLENATINVTVADGETYEATAYKENITIAGNNTLDFEVGCGNKTITLGEGEFDTVLNFITDTREGIVSKYEILKEDVETGSITIARYTGTPDYLGNISSTGMIVDKITITDYLTNGAGNVTFKADAVVQKKIEGTKTYSVDSINALVEDITGPQNYDNPVGITFAQQTIVSSEENPFQGSFLSEKIFGSSVDDFIYGNNGDDYINGKSGNDYLNGGDGNDSLYGDAGDDTIYGWDGNDYIDGGAGNDTIYGGYDDDTISGGKGSDTIYGGLGNDKITETSHSSGDVNRIYGGEGDDTITVSGTYDNNEAYVYGEAGADTVNVSAQKGKIYLEDLNSEDTLKHSALAGAEYSYTKDGQDLVITQTNGSNVQTMTIKDHFTRYEDGTQLDKFYIGEIDNSLLEHATINVTVADGDTYTATDYKEAIVASGEATIIGADSNDTVAISGAEDIEFAREDNDLVVNGNVVLKDYFTSTDRVSTVNDVDYSDAALTKVTFGADADNMVITNDNPNLIVKFSEEKFENISFAKSGTDLVITHGDNKTITVENYFNEDGSVASDVISKFQVNDETANTYTLGWHTSNVTGLENMYLEQSDSTDITSVPGIRNWINSGAGDDTIVGANAGDMLAGNSGDNDITAVYGAEVYGEGGVDTVTAAGNNFIWTGGGNDVIKLAGGYNTVVFSDNNFGDDTLTGATATDTLKFSLYDGTNFQGYKIDDLAFNRDGSSDDLVISTESGNKVTVQDFFNADSKVDSIMALEENSETEEKEQVIFSLLKDNTIGVQLSDGESYLATEYSEAFAGNGKINGFSKKDTLAFQGANLSFTRDGDNLIVSDDDNDSVLTVEEYFAKGKSVGNIIYAGLEEPVSLKSITDTLADLHPIEAETKGTVKGTTAAETIVASSKGNTIKGGGGNDVIYAFAGKNNISTQSRVGDEAIVVSGIGNDTMTAGLGTDTYYFGHGHGTDTVIGNTAAEKTILMFEAGDILSYKESGSDLVITQKYEIAPGTGLYVSENVILKDYVTNGYKNMYVDYNGASAEFNLRNHLLANETFILGNSKATKAQTVTGSFLNENLYGGSGNDVLKAGRGVDLLVGGKGNDKLYGNAKDVAGNEKTFRFAKKDGADTIYNGKTADTIKFTNVYDGSNMKYDRKGDNLVITYNSYTSGKKTVNDTITLANYFTTDKAAALKNIEFANGTIIDIQSQIMNFTGSGKIAGTVYNDAITGSAKNDTYTLTQGGKDTVYDAKGNDKYSAKVTGSLKITDKAGQDAYTLKGNGSITVKDYGKANEIYNVTNTGKTAIADANGNDTYNISGAGTTTITDYKGNDTYNVSLADGARIKINDKAGKDTLVLNNIAKNDIVYGLDINADGTFASNSLFVLDKNGTGRIEISNYFRTKTNAAGDITNITTGADGAIETIKAGSKKVANFDALDVNDIKQSVAAWFTTHTGYASTSAVFEGGDATDIQSLIAAYNPAS